MTERRSTRLYSCQIERLEAVGINDTQIMNLEHAQAPRTASYKATAAALPPLH